MWDSLYNWKGSISEVSKSFSYQYILPIYIQNSPQSQIIIKNNTGLYILVEGTGQVYQATKQTPRLIEFTRIDSTVYFGYNFNAINFSYHDTIFSYGGTGYWLTNGHLRYFNQRKEWNAIELPSVYPSSQILHNFLPLKSKLFFVQMILYKKLGYYNEGSDNSVIEIDLENKKNTILGRFNTNFLPEIASIVNDYYSINVESLEGTIVFTKGQFYLLRFIDNTVYELVNKKIIDQFLFSSSDKFSNIFEKNGSIYYNSVKDSSIHHFEISLTDFKKEPYQLYEPLSNNLPVYYSIAGIIFIGTGLFFFRKKLNIKYLIRQSKTDKIKISEDSIESSSIETLENKMDFNAIETILIEQIIYKANKNERFTVTELNNTLGLNKKSLEIQKKIRTETINRINHKFKIKYNKETVLIERIRSEDDRRFYLYTISKENANLISQKA